MVCLQDPIRFFRVGDDLVSPFDLQMARRPLAGWRTGKRRGIEFGLCGRHGSLEHVVSSILFTTLFEDARRCYDLDATFVIDPVPAYHVDFD